jgi:hypothetical protein
MSAAASTLTLPPDGQESRAVTLLELVTAVSEVTEDDREVVATVLEMLRSGRVHLCGSFRGHPIEDLTR